MHLKLVAGKEVKGNGKCKHLVNDISYSLSNLILTLNNIKR